MGSLLKDDLVTFKEKRREAIVKEIHRRIYIFNK